MNDLNMLDISENHGDFKLKLKNQHRHSKSYLRPEVNTERSPVFYLQQCAQEEYSTQWSKPTLPRKMFTKFFNSVITICAIYTS